MSRRMSGRSGTVAVYRDVWASGGCRPGRRGIVMTLQKENQCFLAGGGTLPFTGAGTWRKSGHHLLRVKISLTLRPTDSDSGFCTPRRIPMLLRLQSTKGDGLRHWTNAAHFRDASHGGDRASAL